MLGASTTSAIIIPELQESKPEGSATGRCRALSLSGGGSKGSFEIGVIQGFINSLPPEDVQYDVVAGVSAGSINAAGMGLFPKGQEQAMVDFIKNVWENLHDNNIWEWWIKIDPAYGILHKAGMWSN